MFIHPELHFTQRMLLFHFYYKIILNINYVSFLLGLSIYRVFLIIKHSKILGPHLIPTPGPIDLKKYSDCSSDQGLSRCQISSGLVEKKRRNRVTHVGSKEKEKKKTRIEPVGNLGGLPKPFAKGTDECPKTEFTGELELFCHKGKKLS